MPKVYNLSRPSATVGVLEPTGTLWPNGEFGMTWRHGGCRQRLDLEEEDIQALVGRTGQPLPVGMGPDAKASALLDLANVPNSHTKCERKPRGSGGLTKHGARMVRNGVELLERKYGNKALSFLTLTLPPMPVEQATQANTEWAEMIRQVNQWLKRRSESAGRPFLAVGVTEVQIKRAASTGHRWLHYHCVFVGRNLSGGWIVSPAEVREAWTSIVRKRVDGFTGVCPGENLVPVRKSASRYLSKYMSKGTDIDGTGDLPSAWWSMSQPLRKKLSGMIGRGSVTGEWLQMLIDEHLERPSEAFLWLYPVVLWRDDGTSFLMGFSGRLKPGYMPREEYFG